MIIMDDKAKRIKLIQEEESEKKPFHNEGPPRRHSIKNSYPNMVHNFEDASKPPASRKEDSFIIVSPPSNPQDNKLSYQAQTSSFKDDSLKS